MSKRRYPSWLSEAAWGGTIAAFVVVPQILRRALGDEEKPTKIRNKPRLDKPTSGLLTDDDIEDPPEDLLVDDRPPCHLPKRRRPGAPQTATGPFVGPGAMYRTAVALQTPAGHNLSAGSVVTLVQPEGSEWLVEAAPTYGREQFVLPLSSLAAFVGDSEEGYCIPPADLEPQAQTEVPFAEGPARPQWPIATDDESKIKVAYKAVTGKFHGQWGRHFGTARKKSGRVHVGVDLGADPGDLVIAAEDGVIDAILPFLCRKYNDELPCKGDNIIERTWAIYVRNDSGILMNYGEIKENSWKEFGLERGVDLGKRIVAGQPIARVSGTKMLHLETMRPETSIGQIRREELQWKKGDVPPPEILDPTRYLVRAWKNKYNQLLGKET